MTKLNLYNYLNLIGFAINALVTFGASAVLNFPDQAALSLKYQTIITPDGFTFAIWGIIFLSEGIFAILQMLPSFRSLKIVQDGVNYWFFVACLAQSAWVLAFGYEILVLALVFMGLILFSLFKIIKLQSRISRSGPKEFWGFRFPFEIHCGWIFAAFALNVNVVSVASHDNEYIQAVVGALSLIALIGVVAYIEYCLDGGPNYVIPAVFAWALFGMFRELLDPSEKLLQTFSNQVISGFKVSTGILSIVMLCVIAALAVLDIKSRQPRTVPTSEATPLLEPPVIH